MPTATQACAVERINKNHGCVHSKARAAMGSRTTIGSLYIFTNEESLLHKETIEPVTLTSFESFVASCNIPAAEAGDVLTSLGTLGIGDYLPA